MMETLHHLFVAPWGELFFQKAVLGGCLIAMVSGVVGCLVVLRRMAFLGDALSHAMIAGVAGGYLFMKVVFSVEAYAPAMLIGSLIAAVLTVVCIGFVSKVTRVKDDTAIGVMYTGIFAGGVVLVSMFKHLIHIDLMHFIMGDVLAIANADLWAAAIASSVVLAAIILFFRAFQITSFDPVMAAAIGLPVALIDYALTVCVSLVVVSAVSMVGVILVVGLLITPAATAYLLSDRLERMMALAAIFGVTSVILGLYVSMWLDTAGGGAVMLVCTLQFVAALIFAPKYGMLARRLRLRRMVPQQLAENVLIELLKAGNGGAAQEHLVAAIEAHPHDAHVRSVPPAVAIKRLVKQGLLAMQDGRVELTETGRAEATRVRRAHRLWETWLEHLGEPAESLHARAQVLEHVNDPNTLEYLDDLLLHPEADPHGQPIPRDPSMFSAGALAPLSYLRQGDRATVRSIAPPATSVTAATDATAMTATAASTAVAALQPGMRVEVLPRAQNGRLWQLRLETGEILQLDHAMADAVVLEAILPAGV